MSSPVLRWGILGTANVARKNWRALRLAGNAVLTGVASRVPGRARRFIDACQAEVPFPVVPAAFDRYEDLLASADVDAVYLPLPTGARREWLLRSVEAGKHVVGEKPCAASAADLAEVLAACRARGVQFMDGVMFHHSARTARVLEIIGDGLTVGEVRRIATQFSFLAPPDFARTNIRADAGLEPQGCVGDLGWYCIRFILLALGGRLPERVVARCFATLRAPGAAAAVPAEVAAELLYADGVSASFYCSFRAGNQQWAHVSGTAGQLYVPDFVLPHVSDTLSFEILQPEFRVDGCEFRMEPNARRVEVAERSHGAVASQEANLFRNFSARVLEGRLEPAWPDLAFRNQLVLDAVMQSIAEGSRAVAVREEVAAPRTGD